MKRWATDRHFTSGGRAPELLDHVALWLIVEILMGELCFDDTAEVEANKRKCSGVNAKGEPFQVRLRLNSNCFESLTAYRGCTFSACQPLGPFTTLNWTA